MGLDMTAYTTNETLTTDVDFDVEQHDILHYWCKHSNLHGWMEELYFAKGGRSRFFNCTNLGLSMADVLRLETAISNDALPSTSGFFFGKSYGDEKDGDLNFICKARTAIEDGKRVFYRPWW